MTKSLCRKLRKMTRKNIKPITQTTMKKYQKPTMTVARMNTEKMICNSDNGGGSTGGWAREAVRNEEEGFGD